MGNRDERDYLNFKVKRGYLKDKEFLSLLNLEALPEFEPKLHIHKRLLLISKIHVSTQYVLHFLNLGDEEADRYFFHKDSKGNFPAIRDTRVVHDFSIAKTDISHSSPMLLLRSALLEYSAIPQIVAPEINDIPTSEAIINFTRDGALLGYIGNTCHLEGKGTLVSVSREYWDLK